MGGFKWRYTHATNNRSATVTTRQDRPDQMHRQGSNSLETVDEGLEHSEKNVYTNYDDPKRSEWITKLQPALKRAKLRLLIETCGKKLSRREIIELRAGHKKPHRRNKELLASILRKHGLL
jgi:hypothetical protein